MQSSSNGIGDGGVVSSNLKGSHCLEAFDYSEKTIVRLNDSVNNGANFLDVDIVDTFELCLKWCCQTDLCNLAVWDQVGWDEGHVWGGNIMCGSKIHFNLYIP